MQKVFGAGRLYVAHLSGVAVGVALAVSVMGFYYGTTMPVQCSHALTGWIASH